MMPSAGDGSSQPSPVAVPNARVPAAGFEGLYAIRHAPVMRGSAAKGSGRAAESDAAMEAHGLWLKKGFDIRV